MVEQVLGDYALAYGLQSVSLRYFNAAGCDPEGELGERHDPETHLIPLVLREALRVKQGGDSAATLDSGPRSRRWAAGGRGLPFHRPAA